jgi:hypothetical protein
LTLQYGPNRVIGWGNVQITLLERDNLLYMGGEEQPRSS